MSETDNVIDLTEYIKLKRGLEKEGRPIPADAQAEFNRRVMRIKESIERIDKLAKELREGVKP